MKKQMVEEMVKFEEKRLRKGSMKLGLSEGGRGRGEMKGARYLRVSEIKKVVGLVALYLRRTLNKVRCKLGLLHHT